MSDRMCVSCGSNIEGQREHLCSEKVDGHWVQRTPRHYKRVYCSDFAGYRESDRAFFCCTSCHEDIDEFGFDYLYTTMHEYELEFVLCCAKHNALFEAKR